MAESTSHQPIRHFTIKCESVEGLDERKEKGRGCYGAVYEVRVNGLPCVAKRLHDILVGRGQTERVREEDRRAVIERFREECSLLSGLRHPNVVQFMGVHYGPDEADISLIMEYMHMDLEHCIKTYHDFPLPYKTSLLKDVAYGLAYLHSLNIVHRDLNTGNILLTESLRAKVADLGVAKLFNRETAVNQTRTICPGAHDFMPPESLEESAKYSAKLDVFSFGHLMVYLVNQKAPLVIATHISVEDIQKKQVQVGMRRRALDQMGRSHHPLYTTAVQCLGDTPAQRPTSRDLVNRMEEICKQHPVSHENSLQVLAILSESVQTLTMKDHELAKLRSKVREISGLSASCDRPVMPLSYNDCKVEESKMELCMRCTTLKKQLCTLEEEKESLICQNEYYVADNEQLDQCVHDQKAQLAALQQEIDAQKEQLRKQGSDLQNAQEMLTAKDQELTVTLQNLCEVMDNIKEPQNILLPQPATGDKKSAIEALQHAYENLEIRWKKDEKIIAQLKVRVLELEERVKHCHQEYVAVVIENTELKRMQQRQKGVRQGQLQQRILETREENSRLSCFIPTPKLTTAAPPTQHYHPGLRHPQHQSKSSDVNSRVCPMCGVRFPCTVDQTDIERHVNSHFDH